MACFPTSEQATRRYSPNLVRIGHFLLTIRHETTEFSVPRIIVNQGPISPAC